MISLPLRHIWREVCPGLQQALGIQLPHISLAQLQIDGIFILWTNRDFINIAVLLAREVLNLCSIFGKWTLSLECLEHSSFACLFSRSSHIRLFATHWTVACQVPLRLLSGKNTGVVTIFFSRGSSRLRDGTCVSYAGEFFTSKLFLSQRCRP